jgi:FkbM family methyltransferase
MRKLHYGRQARQDGEQLVRLPWGDDLVVSAGDAIGRSILTLGVHELVVSEVLWRLVDPGETCLDVGANLGYMTSLLSARVGSPGRVHAFEPHPTVFARLKRNLANFTKREAVTIYDNAVGAVDGIADLFESSDFAENEGTSSLVMANGEALPQLPKHRVSLRRLDSLFAEDDAIGLMKIDVEGGELDVLTGATRLLTGHRVRDIVWEDHAVYPSESAQILFENGYRIFQFAKRVLGPSVWEPSGQPGTRKLPWETPNYLATLDPARAESRLRARGWYCLRGTKAPCGC